MVLTFYDRPKSAKMKPSPSPWQGGGRTAAPPIPRYASGTMWSPAPPPLTPGHLPIPTVDNLPQPAPPKPMDSPVMNTSWNEQGNLQQDGYELITDPTTGEKRWLPISGAGRDMFIDQMTARANEQAAAAAPKSFGGLDSGPGGFNPWTFNAQIDEQKRRNDIQNATIGGYTEKGFTMIDGKPVSWGNAVRGYDDEGNMIGTMSRAKFTGGGTDDNGVEQPWGAEYRLINGLGPGGKSLGPDQGAFMLGVKPDPYGIDKALGTSALNAYLGEQIDPQPFGGASGPGGLAVGTPTNPFATPNAGNAGGFIQGLPSYNEGRQRAYATGDSSGLIAALQAGNGQWPSGETGSTVTADAPGQTGIGTNSTTSGTIYDQRDPQGNYNVPGLGLADGKGHVWNEATQAWESSSDPRAGIGSYSGIPDAQAEAIQPGSAETITVGAREPFTITEDMWFKGFVIVDAKGNVLDAGTVIQPGEEVIVYRMTPEEMSEALRAQNPWYDQIPGANPEETPAAPIAPWRSAIPGGDPNENGGVPENSSAPNDVQATGGIDSFLSAISGQESGGDYSATNADSGAHGKYQIMPANWPSWAAEAGIPGAAQTPENQERVVRFKVQQYYNQYGNWEDVAAVWYSGQPFNEATADRPQNGYPTIREYVNSVMSRMGGRMAQGGYTTAPVFMVGDARGPNPAAGGARPEMIKNPTGAPIQVMSHEQTQGMMPRYADGTGGWTPPTGIDPTWGWTPPTFPAPPAADPVPPPPAPTPTGGTTTPTWGTVPPSVDPPERPPGTTTTVPPSVDPAGDIPFGNGQQPPPPGYTPPAPFSFNLGNLSGITTGPGGLGSFGVFGTSKGMAPGFGGWDTSPSSGGAPTWGQDYWDYQAWLFGHPGGTYEQYLASKAPKPAAGTNYGNAFGDFSTNPYNASFWLQAPAQQMQLFEEMARSMGWDPDVPNSGPYTPEDLYTMFKRLQLRGVDAAGSATGY